MAQVLTPAEIAALASKLQIANRKHRGEIEIDHVVPAVDPVVDPAIVQSAVGLSTSLSLPANVTPGNIVLVLADAWKSQDGPPNPPYTGSLFAAFGGQAAWSDLVPGAVRTAASGERSSLAAYAKVADGTERTCNMFVADVHLAIYELEGCTLDDLVVVSQDVPGTDSDLDIGSLGSPAAGQLAFLIAAQYTNDLGGGFMAWDAMGWTVDDSYDHPFFSASRPYLIGHQVAAGGALEAEVGSDVSFPWAGIGILFAASDTGSPAVVSTARIQVARIDVDRSRKLAAAQLNVTLDNERGDRGYYTATDPIFVPNNPIRAYAWHGPRANRVCIHTGLLDRPHEHRNPKTIELTARSRMKWLIEQGFESIGPQSVDDEHAIRTEANGVYLGKSPEYIVGDVLDRAGWPAADRVIGVSGVTLAEYALADGSSWLEQIVGSDRLTGAAGFDLWDDELGLIHFDVSPLRAALEPDPAWTFAAGVNVTALDHEVDDIDRVTRVKVTGSMTSEIPAWKQEWATTAILHPVGSMYRPSESGYLYVVDRLTPQNLFKLRQSDRKIVEKWPLDASLTNQAIGLSGDPTDSAHFYVLDAHLPGSGTYTNCKVRKFDVATKALVSTTTLPDGQWSDMKFDGSHLFLTNFGDDKLYVKTFVAGGAAGATSSHSYAGKTNPTGLWLLGTTIGLFFNGGDAFYLVDTSAPGTITGTQSTKGTRILGGEATGSVLYATNEAGDFEATAGHVWKFQLTEEITTHVFAVAVDAALEDALGFQSGIADRDHDEHPGDDRHPFEIRQVVIALKVVGSLAQAQAVAEAELVARKRLRRVLDLATVGHPGIQLNDPIRHVDPVAGMDASWVIDSYRQSLDAGGTFASSMSVLPWEPPA